MALLLVAATLGLIACEPPPPPTYEPPPVAEGNAGEVSGVGVTVKSMKQGRPFLVNKAGDIAHAEEDVLLIELTFTGGGSYTPPTKLKDANTAQPFGVPPGRDYKAEDFEPKVIAAASFKRDFAPAGQQVKSSLSLDKGPVTDVLAFRKPPADIEQFILMIPPKIVDGKESDEPLRLLLNKQMIGDLSFQVLTSGDTPKNALDLHFLHQAVGKAPVVSDRVSVKLSDRKKIQFKILDDKGQPKNELSEPVLQVAFEMSNAGDGKFNYAPLYYRQQETVGGVVMYGVTDEDFKRCVYQYSTSDIRLLSDVSNKCSDVFDKSNTFELAQITRDMTIDSPIKRKESKPVSAKKKVEDFLLFIPPAEEDNADINWVLLMVSATLFDEDSRGILAFTFKNEFKDETPKKPDPTAPDGTTPPGGEAPTPPAP